MHTNVNLERNSWRVPEDDTVQVVDPRSKKEKELVGDDQEEKRNWTGIFLSLLVIGFVITGVMVAIYILGYVDELLYWSGRRMKLEEVLQGDLQPQRLPGTWLSGEYYVFQNDDGGLSVFHTQNNSITLLVTNHTLRQLDVQGYDVSGDMNFVLFKHNVKKVFRHSFSAYYTVYDVKNDHHLPIRLNRTKVQPSRLQFAKWIGNSTSIVLVQKNDIFLKESPFTATIHRLTETGSPGVIYNGVPDWLYEEDIFDSFEALWPSPDGRRLLFVSFNDSMVHTLQYPWFSSTTNTKSKYPDIRTVRYPTPGTPNPEVRLWVMDITDPNATQRWEVKPPLILEGHEYYLTSAGWVGDDNDQVAAVWLNRAQNLSVISACLEPNWTCIETHAERALENSWIDIKPFPVFSQDGRSFLLLAPIQEGNADYFSHIKLVTLKQNRIAVLSHGRYEVIKILGWDGEHHQVYYIGTHETRPGQRHLYIVRDPFGEDSHRAEPLCVTCQPPDKVYTNCTYYSSNLSPSLEHYALECYGPGLPISGMHSASDHKLLKVLQTNKAKLPRLSELALPTVRTFQVPLPQNCRAQVQLLLPPSWREELRDAAFPVLVEVNGRPGAQSVTDKFLIDWGTYMSSRNDIVYVRLDVRGAGGQGKRSLSSVYKRIGGVEVQDQITVLEYLLETLGFLDETRVGVWGWGYGGYVTAMVLGSQQSVFKCGVSVSPIADWMFYNSAFTERVLGVPAENYKGYVEADATQRGSQIPPNSLFILHGMADVTAPYQHGMALAKSLSDAGVIFRYQNYADEGHTLSGVMEHVYHSMEDFLHNCLNLDVEES